MVIKKNIGSLWQTVINFFTKGHQRSLEAKKNIAGSLLIKGISIIISLLLVPLTIDYVSKSKYGVWLALSSIISWVSFFDIGFTHGLRNKFTEAKSKADNYDTKVYISTTYYYVALLFSCVWVLLIILNQFVNWHSLLKLPASDEAEISKLAIIIFTNFCLQFVFKIISTILTADQQPAKASLIDMLGQLLALIVIFLFTKTTTGNLIYLGLTISVAPTLVLFFANIYFFKTRYKYLVPGRQFVKKEYAKDIMNLGGKFFVLQVSAMIQFETSLFLVAKFFGAEKVPDYSIAYKYFSVLQMGFAIMLSPLWSGVTDAYTNKEYDWIRNAIKKYLRLLVLFILAGAVMLIASGRIYDLWVGKGKLNITFAMSFCFFLFFSTGMFASIFVSVINGIGALRIQFYSAIISAFVFIVLAFTFHYIFNMGMVSVIVSSIISNVFGYVIAPLQVYKIFYEKSKSPVWYK
jgi:O-antigen/teichoic acid export membrane protein